MKIKSFVLGGVLTGCLLAGSSLGSCSRRYVCGRAAPIVRVDPLRLMA